MKSEGKKPIEIGGQNQSHYGALLDSDAFKESSNLFGSDI
jgi:hypothetical protein